MFSLARDSTNHRELSCVADAFLETTYFPFDFLLAAQRFLSPHFHYFQFERLLPVLRVKHLRQILPGEGVLGTTHHNNQSQASLSEVHRVGPSLERANDTYLTLKSQTLEKCQDEEMD